MGRYGSTTTTVPYVEGSKLRLEFTSGGRMRLQHIMDTGKAGVMIADMMSPTAMVRFIIAWYPDDEPVLRRLLEAVDKLLDREALRRRRIEAGR